jgi:hypothetical protein
MREQRFNSEGRPLVRDVLIGAAGVAAGIALALAWTRRPEHDEAAADGPGPTTPATNPRHAAETPIGPAGRNIEDRLDEALQESFPTSDPVSIQVD